MSALVNDLRERLRGASVRPATELLCTIPIVGDDEQISVDHVKTSNQMRLLTIAVLILLTFELAQAEPRQSKERNRNYILRRQEAGQVQGVPTSRLIIGKREIDIYPNGLMFEGDHVVGVTPRPP